MQNLNLLVNNKVNLSDNLNDEDLQMRIATEIYLTEKMVRIHYSDLMSDVPLGTISKQSLVNWLNDNYRNGILVRKGIITLYRERKPEHFKEDGKWISSNFSSFVQFAFESFLDESDLKIIKDKKVVKRFHESISSEEWRDKAILLMGLKLLEDLYLQGGLSSNLAIYHLRKCLIHRELLSRMGAIIGRVGKNNELDDVFNEEVHDALSVHSEKMLNMNLSVYEDFYEYEIYMLNKERVLKGLKFAIRESLEPDIQLSLELNDEADGVVYLQ